MTINPQFVTTGTIDGGATAIEADVSGASGYPWTAVFVTLSSDYSMVGPLSFPARPSFAGAAAPDVQYPGVLPNGTRFQTFQCEADALIEAGAAVAS